MELNVTNASWTDKLKIYFIVYLLHLINSIISILIFLFFRKSKEPDKILIFRIGSLGDSICAIPALMNIKENFPKAQIDILTSTGNTKGLVSLESLLSTHYYDSIINYDSKSLKELTVLLKVNHYDLVVHLPQQGAGFFKNVRDLIYFRFVIGIKSGFGWSVGVINIFRKAQNKYIIFDDERSRLNKLLSSQYGLLLFFKDQFSFIQTPEDDTIITTIYTKTVQKKELPNIAIVVGAKRPSNRWPILYFREVIKEFSTHYNMLIIGGKDDISLANLLTDLPNTYSFCGLLTPLQSGLLFKKCVLTLSNDTGPMHLSYALATPVVGIFSNRDYPYLWYPPLNGSNTVHRSKPLSCSVCLTEACPNENLCMKNITPTEVIASVKGLLAQQR